MAYRDHKIIAIDFDGTCVHHEFPEIGEPLPHAVRVMQRIAAAGHHIVLYTCRENDAPCMAFSIGRRSRAYLDEAIEWFKKNEIPLNGINENTEEDDFRPHNAATKARKPYANLYIDDKGLGSYEAIDWLTIEQWLLKKGWLGYAPA